MNARDSNDNTSLMGAAAHGKLETCDFLIKSRGDLNALDRIGATALMKVCVCAGARVCVCKRERKVA